MRPTQAAHGRRWSDRHLAAAQPERDPEQARAKAFPTSRCAVTVHAARSCQTVRAPSAIWIASKNAAAASGPAQARRRAGRRSTPSASAPKRERHAAGQRAVRPLEADAQVEGRDHAAEAERPVGAGQAGAVRAHQRAEDDQEERRCGERAEACGERARTASRRPASGGRA